MDALGLTVADGVAELVLDDQDRRNAIGVDLARAMVERCDEIDADPGIGAVIVRAEGRSFCSGADRRLLAAIAEDPLDEQNYSDLATIYAAFLRIATLLPPTIALVQGPAVGAGLNLALSTDVRIVSPRARLLSGFLKIGVHPGGGHYTMLSKLAGPQVAAAMGLFGEEVNGADCVSRGLAWKEVPAADLVAEGRRLALAAAADPVLARRATRSYRVQAEAPWLSREVAVQAEQSVQMWSFANGPLAAGKRDRRD